MAHVTSCDGCGQIEGDGVTLERYGITEARDYCQACEPLVKRYLDERDELHENLAEEFRNDHQALIQAWNADRPNGQLPDFRRQGDG